MYKYIRQNYQGPTNIKIHKISLQAIVAKKHTKERYDSQQIVANNRPTYKHNIDSW
jgi:hypothetical protein